jgi:translin
MVADLAALPDLYYTGYTQDALKELAEAHLVHAFVTGASLPTPEDLAVPSSTFLNGMSEAASEMRRFALDMIRLGRVEEALPYLAIMDEVYSQQITIDFPDAITGGLRRQTDVLRSILERTRGDVTMSTRQEAMRQALATFEARMMGGALPDAAPLFAALTESDE